MKRNPTETKTETQEMETSTLVTSDTGYLKRTCVGDECRWRVVDREGRPVQLKAEIGQTLTWILPDDEEAPDEVFFQFPEVLFEPPYDAHTVRKRRGESLKGVVSERALPQDASSKRHVYAAFCFPLIPVSKETGEQVGYAEGGSPPDLIIVR